MSRNTFQEPGLQTLAELIDPALQRIEAFRSRHEEVSGVPTGYSRLDGMLGGLPRGRLTVVGAYPATGLTTFGLNVALNAAGAGHGVVFVSCTEPALEVASRILGMQSGIQFWRTRCGFVSPVELERMHAATTALHDLPLVVDVSCRPTVEQIIQQIRCVRESRPVDLVIVDSLRWVRPACPTLGFDEGAAKVAEGLMDAFRGSSTAVMLLTGVDRDPRDPEAPPRLRELSLSCIIEPCADVVLLLHRPERCERDDGMDGSLRGRMEVRVAKNIDGPANAGVSLNFDGDTQRITEGED